MARKPVEVSVDATLDALINKVNTKFKHRVIARGEDVPNTFFLRRPSGIMQLDIDTGGGLPAGGWCLLSGPEGGGKSTLLYKYYGYQQRLHGADCRLALGVSEFLPDYFYMRDCGVKIAIPDVMIEERNEWRVRRNLPHFTKEQILEFKTQVGRFDIIRGATGDELLAATAELFGSKAYQIVGVDSVSVLLPEVDADKELAGERVDARAASANLQTRFAKRFHPLTLGLDDDRNETTLVMISQVRANNKKSEAQANIAKYLHDWAATGAYAMRHGKLIDICIWPGSRIKKGADENRHQTGKTLNWEIIKGKAGTHDGIRGEVDFDFQTQTDDPGTIWIAGLQTGVIAEAKTGFDVQRIDTKEKLLKGFSKKGVIDKLKADFDFQLAVRIEILASLGIQCRYR